MMIDYMENKQLKAANGQQQQQLNFQQPTGAIAPSVPAQQPQNTFSNQPNQLLPITSLNQYSQQRQALHTQQQHRTSNDGGTEMLIKIDSLQQLQPAVGSNNSELIGYYFGSISRETAEWILKTHGSQMDGAYLLRSSGPNDDFVLSLLVVNPLVGQQNQPPLLNMEVLHYKIVETEDSFVALHGQVGDEKFATIDELIDKAQGVATKPRWPIQRQSLESHILPPTYWGLTVDQVRLAILIKAKQWGFPMFSSMLQQQANFNADQQQHQQMLSNGGCNNDPSSTITTLNNETIRTLIYKSLHEFQPWFHGKISREEAERRIEQESSQRDGRFLVRERDNYSYAMCISHKKTTKHYRIDVLPTGELAIQDGRKFTSLMALVSHYTIMSDGLWCALTEACLRPIQTNCNNLAQTLQNGGGCGNNFVQQPAATGQFKSFNQQAVTTTNNNNLYCRPVFIGPNGQGLNGQNMILPPISARNSIENGSQKVLGVTKAFIQQSDSSGRNLAPVTKAQQQQQPNAVSTHQAISLSNSAQIKAPIKEWLQTINHKWSQFISSKNQHQSLNSFLFGSSNPLNNHCRHHGSGGGGGGGRTHHSRHHHRHDHSGNRSNTGSSHPHHRRKTKIINQASSSNTCVSHPQAPLNDTSSIDNGHTRTPGQVDEMLGTMRRASCNCCLLPSANGQQAQQNFAMVLPAQQSQLQLGDINNLNLAPNGFSLNGQSFVGSTLFDVRPANSFNREATFWKDSRKGPGSNGSTNSNSSSSGNKDNTTTITGEEKLISPAQSISSHLNNSNNQYNLGTEIYKSTAASTVLVRDQCQPLPTNSSSSSSGGCNQQSINGITGRYPQHIHGLVPSSYLDQVNQFTANDNNSFTKPSQLVGSAGQIQQHSINSPKIPQLGPTQQSTSHTGGIFCGQHAGPAYRYTNCTGNENLGPCPHNQTMRSSAPSRGLVPHRASDDSQLLTTGTQLAGPAALTKFVQFQDGQCLRTHRDARSIQMAYLLASQQAANSGGAINHQRQSGAAQQSIRAMASNGQQPTTSTGVNNNILKFNANNGNDLGREDRTVQGSNYHQQALWQHQQARNCQNQDVDLIDCDGEGFNFKYDPKLIKSSSIETLCGAGEDEQKHSDNDDYDLTNFKTNSELVMSLKPCWFGVQTKNLCPEPELLYPVPVHQNQQANNQANEACDASNSHGLQQQQQQQQNEKHDNDPIISSLMAEAANESVNQNDHYDSLRKKHDLDELTTNLLTELTASLKAQIDLKNKRSGFASGIDAPGAQTALQSSAKQTSSGLGYRQNSQQESVCQQARDPRELAYEFDTLIQ